MFKNIKWVGITLLLGYIIYLNYQTDVDYRERIKSLESQNAKIENRLEFEVDKRIAKMTIAIVDDAVAMIERNNQDYVSAVDSILEREGKRHTELMTLLHEKIDYYGIKIDEFDGGLDSTIQSYITSLEVVVNYKDELVRRELTDLRTKSDEFDVLMNKLKNNWRTKGILK